MKSVVICGSRRFETGIRRWGSQLKQLGVVVFEPHLHQGGEEWGAMSEEYKNFVLLGLTYDHFQKIRQADVVFVYNEGGYTGVNTTLELGFAAALAKPIYSLGKDPTERGRDVLFNQHHPSSPEELVTFL